MVTCDQQEKVLSSQNVLLWIFLQIINSIWRYAELNRLLVGSSLIPLNNELEQDDRTVCCNNKILSWNLQNVYPQYSAYQLRELWWTLFLLAMMWIGNRLHSVKLTKGLFVRKVSGHHRLDCRLQTTAPWFLLYFTEYSTVHLRGHGFFFR